MNSKEKAIKAAKDYVDGLIVEPEYGDGVEADFLAGVHWAWSQGIQFETKVALAGLTGTGMILHDELTRLNTKRVQVTVEVKEDE